MGDHARGISIENSYEHCRRMARGSSFYPAFYLVDRARRRALWAVYAFNRHCDDLSDSTGANLEALENWRVQLRRALDQEPVEDAIWPAFIETAKRYEIPESCFFDMIDGVSSDLTQKTRQTYQDVYRYCYQVASVVGVSVASIFGAQSPEARLLAEKCGVAVQLTNILRDVQEDWKLGRVYLAQEDLREFGVTSIVDSTPMRSLLRDYGRRAHQLFDEGRPLESMVCAETRACLHGILDTYRQLLGKLEQRDFGVFGERVRLSKPEKLLMLAKAAMNR